MRPKRLRTIRAGLPTTTAPGGTSLETTAPAPMMLPEPTVTPGRMIARAPIHTSSAMITGAVWQDDRSSTDPHVIRDDHRCRGFEPLIGHRDLHRCSAVICTENKDIGPHHHVGSETSAAVN